MPRAKHRSCRNSTRRSLLGRRTCGCHCGVGALSRPEGTLVKSRRGFTLIELLIVVVIIGLLAAIAIPKFANTKDKAHIASMKTDLRNLATVEEAFFYDSATYTTSFALMNNYTPSVGVTVVINEATSK